MVFNRNKNGVDGIAVFGLEDLWRAGWAGAERREGLKHPPLPADLGVIAKFAWDCGGLRTAEPEIRDCGRTWAF